MITANRVYNFVAKDAQDMHKWISALSPRRKVSTLDVEQQQILERGQSGVGWATGLCHTLCSFARLAGEGGPYQKEEVLCSDEQGSDLLPFGRHFGATGRDSPS